MEQKAKNAGNMRWRKQANETGLARVRQGPRGFELGPRKHPIIHVSPCTQSADRWYWYGSGRNTLSDNLTFASADGAKHNAMLWLKAGYLPEESK